MSDTERTAVVELSASEARDAHIAASKMGMDRDRPAMEELRRAFDDESEDYPSGQMRFMAPSVGLCEIAVKAQTHGKERRSKGHNAAQSKYYSVGDKMESQLIFQGEWVEVGRSVHTGIEHPTENTEESDV